jgi:hypothetical protein
MDWKNKVFSEAFGPKPQPKPKMAPLPSIETVRVQQVDTKAIEQAVLEKVLKEIKDKKMLDVTDLKNAQSIIYPNKKQQDLRWHGAGVTKIIAGTGITITNTGEVPGLSDVTINATGGGGGITSINADATAAQILNTGTSGTDFAIADNGTGTHTFNLPIASGTNTGKLSNTDWTTFNSKIDAAHLISNEAPAGSINGINTVFTTANNFVANSTHVYLNGLRQRIGGGNDYTETAVNQITFAVAPSTGDIIVIDYIKS